MVMVKEKFPRLCNGDIDETSWLELSFPHYPSESIHIISEAYDLAKLTHHDEATFYGQSCFEQALECAEILGDNKADATSIASTLIYCTLQDSDVTLEDIQEQLPGEVTLLVKGLMQMSAITQLHQQTNRASKHQIDNLRKMLLAMVADVRIVLIMLALRVCIMRGIQVLGIEERKTFSQETMDMFAPLANRLGIGSIKWELEDLSFHDLEPDTYHHIAKELNETRIQREDRIDEVISTLKTALFSESISADITGRAKHIYSIHKKMERKSLPFTEIYDTHAVRVIVKNVEQCYSALSLTHDLWESIPEEFDDYINTPKPNGYQSIHTAVHGPGRKHLEIQIRTEKMHQENELGGAAHWLYKEGSKSAGGYEEKIAWLRELLDWHRELAHHDDELDRFHDRVFEERIYVFTPSGDIMDLNLRSTPLDFAYHVHSDVGHRCKGAKVNGKLVPLIYQLKTGDRVEIVTAKEPKPSRDWLTQELGYLATVKARAKVHQWFKHQDAEKNVINGRNFLEKELDRLHITDINLEKIAHELNAKTSNQLYVGLACGNIKLSQVIQTIKVLYPQTKIPERNAPKLASKTRVTPPKRSTGINLHGVSNLMTHIAHCCQPIPGDPIIGYITMGKGVSIHHQHCNNIAAISDRGQARLIEAEWNSNQEQKYVIDLKISSKSSSTSAPLLTVMLTNEKIKTLHFQEKSSNQNTYDLIELSVQLDKVETLNKIITKIKQIEGVVQVKRTSYYGVDT
jgi:GTP pyrophosphokinase